MEDKEIYIGEYSCSQGCYHIITVQEAIKTNAEMAAKGVYNDYIPIFYGNSYEDVKGALEIIQNIMGRPQTYEEFEVALKRALKERAKQQ